MAVVVVVWRSGRTEAGADDLVAGVYEAAVQSWGSEVSGDRLGDM